MAQNAIPTIKNIFGNKFGHFKIGNAPGNTYPGLHDVFIQQTANTRPNSGRWPR